MARDLMAAGSAAVMLLYTVLALAIAEVRAAAGDADASVVSMEGGGYAVVEEDDAYVPMKCHHCYRSVHGEDCVHMLNRFNLEERDCSSEERFCAVEWMKTEGELTTYSRGCAATCVEGCVTAGEMYQRCHKCCEGNYCNIHLGSQSTSPTLAPSFIATVAASFIHAMLT